jgi:histidyl-tRNA synthetase
MKKGPLTPKGFRDILPDQAKKRREMINQIVEVLEGFGFVPLETPTIEFAETLLGKYGEEEKLIYQFTDRGGRNLALRYDLTVPLARFIANNLGLLKPTFSGYQIGQCFRGENPQKGRFREFTQFDFDIVGSYDISEDAKIIETAIKAARAIGLNRATMMLNNRSFFKGIPIEVVRAWDKYNKIGLDGFKDELKNAGFSPDETESFLNRLGPGRSKCKEYLDLVPELEKLGLKERRDFMFDRTLARGLDYYTGTIMELKPYGGLNELSIGGGGRYDNLIGIFAGRDIPAVGFSFGIDRILDLLK